MKAELIQKIETLFQGDHFPTIKKEFSDLRREFQTHSQNAFHEALNAYKELPEESRPEEFEYNRPAEDDRFKELLDVFKEKKEKFIEQKRLEKIEKLKSKREIVTEIDELVKNDLSINEAFNKFNAIQDKWKAVGYVDGDEGVDLMNKFNYSRELFYYNVNINKELRDLDFKKNLTVKEEIIAKLKELEGNDNIRECESQLKTLQRAFNEAGPVPYEKKDEIFEVYKTTGNTVFAKIQAHYDSKRGEFRENLKQKIALCEQLNAVIEGDNKSHKNWQEGTESILKIQEEWKKVGYSEKNETIWDVFRSSCDRFFNSKREFYTQLDSQREKNAEAKMSLVEQAEKLKNETSWKQTTEQLIALQKSWKEVGPAKRNNERELWDKFRGACDHFFNAKKEHFKDMVQEQDENLKIKEALILQINSFQLSGDHNSDLNSLKEFSKQWGEIGFVPLKQKDAIYKGYHAALDKQFDKLRVNRNEVAEIKYQNKLEGMLSGGSEGALNNEKRSLQNQINKLSDDVKTYENNIGFFGKSNKVNPLLGQVEQQLKRTKAELHDLKGKLRMIKSKSAKAEKTE